MLLALCLLFWSSGKDLETLGNIGMIRLFGRGEEVVFAVHCLCLLVFHVEERKYLFPSFCVHTFWHLNFFSKIGSCRTESIYCCCDVILAGIWACGIDLGRESFCLGYTHCCIKFSSNDDSTRWRKKGVFPSSVQGLCAGACWHGCGEQLVERGSLETCVAI